jgi:hypothetical protein
MSIPVTSAASERKTSVKRGSICLSFAATALLLAWMTILPDLRLAIRA